MRLKEESILKWYENVLNGCLRTIKFIFVCLIAFMIYQNLFASILTKKIHIFIYIVFWAFTAYLFLPWLNRLLTKFYVPDYFIGRTKTNDGLLGDPINLAFYGTEKELVAAFKASGWHIADPLSIRSSWKITLSSILGKSYPTAPVSSLFLFSRKQDLAFEMEIDGNPRKRHHIRIWQTPKDWHLPGGKTSDWLGAATYDKHVGLSLFTGQITHKIDANVDHERDFVIDCLKKGTFVKAIEVVPHFTSSYHARNGGGDRIHTDGALPFITIKNEKSS